MSIGKPAFFLFILVSVAWGQGLSSSGVAGIDLVYATSADGSTSALFAVSLGFAGGPAAVQLGDGVSSVPSRWAHRRRTLGALETAMVFLEEGLVITPMGGAVGQGALHLVDARGGTLVSALVPTENPASYDVVVSESLSYVLVAEDDGMGNTLLRGFSYATPGALTPLDPQSIVLSGSPCALVTEMGMEPSGTRVQVPTSTGVSIVDLAVNAPQMTFTSSVSTAPRVPVTNPASFDRNGTPTWMVGTSEFSVTGEPREAGYAAWSSDGTASVAGVFGIIPALLPPRSYVPAAGTTELAVVGNGVNTYAYFLLRDPSPTASFIRPSAVGVVRFLGSSAPVVSKILYPDVGGEPFAIPSVHGTRIAIESSQGPPFNFFPPDGGEPISILYTPLDPLGAGTNDGVLAVPSPLGGRISTKGMERPLWTRDGTRVVSVTSHFPGAPNPGSPGIEVLNVPATVPLTLYNPPHYVVPNFVSPFQSIVYPSSFAPRDPLAAPFLDAFSFVGNVFHNGMASIMVTPFGELGQFNQRAQGPFVQSPNVPNFPAIHPPAFEDANGSLVPIPGNFGARRTSWNLYPGLGMTGLVMGAAMDDTMLYQPSGVNFQISFGLLLGPILQPAEVSLPSGWITSTEIVSI